MKLFLVTLILILLLPLGAEVISIGQGTVVSQGLPIEPVARYTYSQQLFLSSEITCGGTISSVSFQYHVVSNVFFEGNRQLRIWLGHTNRSNMNPGWVSLDSLSLVFDGLLQQQFYDNGLPGDGWLNIPLAFPFSYNGMENLVLAVDENSSEYGSNADDFLCSSVGTPLAIQFQSASTNPDPANPPASGYNFKTHRSNIRLDIDAQHYTPVQPSPAPGANGVAIDSNFFWTSICESFSLYLGTHPDSLMLVASAVPLPFWQSEAPMQFNTQYFWRVTGLHAGEQYPSALWSFQTATQAIGAPQNLSGFYNGQSVMLSWQAPGYGTPHYYKIYRNSALLASCLETSYIDTAVQPGQVYYYYASAMNLSGTESGASNLVSVTIPASPPQPILQQGFEACDSFGVSIPFWQNIDYDLSLTWAWDNVNYPHEGEALAWLCFEPGQTVPPLTGHNPYAGSKMLLAMSSLNPPNNDWLISPAIHIGQEASLSFYARSAVADFGLERLKLLISTTDTNPASFIPINPGAYLSVPVAWTNYSYSLSQYANQRVYLAWNCFSVDAFALFLDKIELFSAGGWVAADDLLAPRPDVFSYPNPAREGFNLAAKDGKPFALEIFNLRGQLLYKQAGITEFDSKLSTLKLGSGIYLLRINHEGRQQVIKQVILH